MPAYQQLLFVIDTFHVLFQGLHTSTSLRTASAAPINSRESSGTPVHMRRMSTPRVESPRLDSYRYSLINLEETLENDLGMCEWSVCLLVIRLFRVSNFCRKIVFFWQNLTSLHSIELRPMSDFGLILKRQT